MEFTRITVDQQKMGGVPCIRGLRIPVATIIEMVADGMSEEEILKAYPDIELEDIREALHYAAAAEPAEEALFRLQRQFGPRLRAAGIETEGDVDRLVFEDR